MKLFNRLIKPVYAHCDLPCGIYETNTVVSAAATCLRMVEKINQLTDINEKEAQNNFVRAVVIKEEHAQKVKDQLYLLWSDYFKPEHLEKFPDLHETFWQAIKQASKVKQTVSLDACEELIHQVQHIAEMFEQSKA